MSKLEKRVDEHDLSIGLLINSVEKITTPVLPVRRKKIGL